jgi:outer membrane protein, heavy metal efflux system
MRCEDDGRRIVPGGRTWSGAGADAAYAAAAWCVLSCAAAAFPQNDGVPAALAANRAVMDSQLRRLTADVLANNPAIKAATRRAEAARLNAAGVKSLEPPQVAVEFFKSPVSSFPNPFRDQAEYDYSLQQTFPFPGKLSSMARAEAGRAGMEAGEKGTAEQDALFEAKVAFFRVYLALRKLSVNAESRDIVRSFAAVAAGRYEVGGGSLSDILRAQTELSRLEADGISLDQERLVAGAALNSLRDAAVDSAVPDIPEIEPPVDGFTLQQVLPIALVNRPELAAAQSGIAMRKSERAAAAWEYYPGFMVRGMYKQMESMPDDWSLMVGLSVPVAPWSLGKYRAATGRAAAAAAEADERLASMKSVVARQVRDAVVGVESARRRIALYRTTILPQAGQALRSTLSGYQTGREDFGALVEAQRTLLAARDEYHAAVADLLMARARLERAAGLSIDEILNGKNSGGAQ